MNSYTETYGTYGTLKWTPKRTQFISTNVQAQHCSQITCKSPDLIKVFLLKNKGSLIEPGKIKLIPGETPLKNFH